MILVHLEDPRENIVLKLCHDLADLSLNLKVNEEQMRGHVDALNSILTHAPHADTQPRAT